MDEVGRANSYECHLREVVGVRMETMEGFEGNAMPY